MRDLEAGSWKLEAELRLVDRTDLAALVIAAVRTDLVRGLRFAALRAGADRYRRQRVVRAPLGRAGLRMAAFRIRHV
jgi:hypothetical protein